MFFLPLIAPKDQVIEVNTKQIQELNQQLIASKQVIALLQQNLKRNEKTIQDLKEDNQRLQQHFYNEPKPVFTQRWKLCQPAPCTMIRGSATVCGNMAYFRRAFTGQVMSYNPSTKEWFNSLPECPTIHFSLAVVNNLITAVGGVQDYNYTNTLFSCKEGGGRQKWVEHFPPMPTKRKLTAVVCKEKVLVVAGGEGEGNTKQRGRKRSTLHWTQ